MRKLKGLFAGSVLGLDLALAASGSADAQPARTVVTLWSWSPVATTTQAMVAAIEKAHPDIEDLRRWCPAACGCQTACPLWTRARRREGQAVVTSPATAGDGQQICGSGSVPQDAYAVTFIIRRPQRIDAMALCLSVA